ncbi:hypothetical protein BLNAU_5606 [Blattamonas nauphoetae]|uniref:Uncharacterized protein n=1 Tax=Blattamonas nauphoetae TaxID=2049346 RepID=A0ABQ9Y6A9_9EUKA|nr:hypothetical protein BLNAU_5606 [Blattamonas nauphoetae]
MPSAPRFLAARHSLHSLRSMPSALASPASRPLHSLPRCTPLHPASSLHALCTCLTYRNPNIPTMAVHHPSNCSPQCPKPARDLELVIFLHPRNIDRTAKTALPEIIVRTESVFPLPFNNKANPLSQLIISNEILGGMGNQISLFTKYPPSTTDQPPKLPKHPAHIHNPLNCYQTWRKRRRPFHHHQKSEGRLRRMNARKSGNAEYWDAILPVLNSHQNKQIPSSKPKKNMKIPTHAK